MRFVIEIPDELFGPKPTAVAAAAETPVPAATAAGGLSGGAAPDSTGASATVLASHDAISAGEAEFGGMTSLPPPPALSGAGIADGGAAPAASNGSGRET